MSCPDSRTARPLPLATVSRAKSLVPGLALALALCLQADASAFEARLNGVALTVDDAWYLVSRNGTSESFSLMKRGDRDAKSGIAATRTANRTLLPGDGALSAMSGAELSAAVRALDTDMGSDTASRLKLYPLHGRTAIVSSEEVPGDTDIVTEKIRIYYPDGRDVWVLSGFEEREMPKKKAEKKDREPEQKAAPAATAKAPAEKTADAAPGKQDERPKDPTQAAEKAEADKPLADKAPAGDSDTALAETAGNTPGAGTPLESAEAVETWSAFARMAGTFRPEPAASAWSTFSSGRVCVLVPGTWDTTVTGAFRGRTAWATMSKRLGREEEGRTVRVSLVEVSGKTAPAKDPVARLNDGTEETLLYHALGIRGTLKSNRVEKSNGMLAGQPARVTTIDGTFDGKEAVVELRDVTAGGKTLCAVSGWFLPLDAASARERETILARMQLPEKHGTDAK